MLFKQLVSRKWILSSLFVVTLSGIFIRLGFWQLDRLQTRRERVANTLIQVNAPVLVINHEIIGQDLSQMEYRHVMVTGLFDQDGEVVLRNQIWVDQNTVHHNGVHLLTPLIIEDMTMGVLVDRGWIPAGDSAREDRAKYANGGEVTVFGIIRIPQTKSEMGMVSDPTLAPGETRLDIWNFVNVKAIEKQLSYPLLEIYIQEEPHAQGDILPYALKEFPELTEGAHLGFAFQWFSLAAIFLIGYPIVVRKQMAPQ